MKTAIVTGGTKKDVDAMAVLALNLKYVSPDLADELIIFHDGIDGKKQSLIQQIMPTRFIRYTCPVNWFKLISNRTIRYFSPMVFCKYECLKLLEEFDTVIWTDYDVLIKEDISEIKYMQGNLLFTVNEDKKLKEMFYPSIKNEDMHLFNMDGECIATPIFVLRRDIKSYIQYYEWCVSMTRKLISHLYLPEQCIITMMTQYFELEYSKLEIPVYCMHPKDEQEITKILHAYGQPKFWNGLYNEQWNNYFEQWKNIQKR